MKFEVLTGDLQNIVTVVGAVLGIICGFFIGRFKVYTSLNKSNTIGDSLNPELGADAHRSQGGPLTIVVGMIFLVMGIAIIIKAPDIAQQNTMTLYIFGTFAAAIGGLCVYAGFKK